MYLNIHTYLHKCLPLCNMNVYKNTSLYYCGKQGNNKRIIFHACILLHMYHRHYHFREVCTICQRFVSRTGHMEVLLSQFSHTFNCVCFSLFWPKKVHFETKTDLFLTFLLLTFLVRILHCVETLILYLFWRWKCKKNHPKRYFSKIAEIFITAKNSFFNVSYTWYKYLVYVCICTCICTCTYRWLYSSRVNTILHHIVPTCTL